MNGVIDSMATNSFWIGNKSATHFLSKTKGCFTLSSSLIYVLSFTNTKDILTILSFSFYLSSTFSAFPQKCDDIRLSIGKRHHRWFYQTFKSVQKNLCTPCSFGDKCVQCLLHRFQTWSVYFENLIIFLFSDFR